MDLASLHPRHVQCVATDDVAAALHDVEQLLERAARPTRLVTAELDAVPAVTQLLDRFVAALAEAALLVWPEWYGSDLGGDPDATRAETNWSDEETVRRLVRQRDGLNAAWLAEAVDACRTNRPPVLSDFTASEQAGQLARALTCDDLVAVVVLPEASPSAERLVGLSRGLEWLARTTGSQVVVVVRESVATRPEFDPVNFGTVDWWSRGRTAAGASEERKHLVCPIVGRPHPASPGERRLASRLSRDAELASLFAFNQRVTSAFESRFLVDLLWREGRVVVEVDGYGHHSSPAAFANDRRRDYELTISGYLVLRLPHDEVVRDVDLAVEKIRDVVRFRRSTEGAVA